MNEADFYLLKVLTDRALVDARAPTTSDLKNMFREKGFRGQGSLDICLKRLYVSKIIHSAVYPKNWRVFWIQREGGGWIHTLLSPYNGAAYVITDHEGSKRPMGGPITGY